MLGRYITGIGDKIFSGFNAQLSKGGLKPAFANYCSLGTAFLCGVCFAYSRITVALVLLIMHGFFDYLDGGIHRAVGKKLKNDTKRILRHAIVDKFSEVFIFLAIPYAGMVPWWLGITASASSIVGTVLGFMGLHKRLIERDISVFDRSDRLIVFLFLAIFSTLYIACLGVCVVNLIIIIQRYFCMFRNPREDCKS